MTFSRMHIFILWNIIVNCILYFVYFYSKLWQNSTYLCSSIIMIMQKNLFLAHSNLSWPTGIFISLQWHQDGVIKRKIKQLVLLHEHSCLRMYFWNWSVRCPFWHQIQQLHLRDLDLPVALQKCKRSTLHILLPT